VTVFPAGLEGTWEGRGHAGISRGIAAFVPRAFLSRVIEQDWNAEPSRVELVRRFLARDPVIEGLVSRLGFEAKHGSPSGSIYAESACEFLAHHLIHAHSSLAASSPQSFGGLPARRLKLVQDFVEEHLARPIGLRQLAELAGMSPRHFERAFRQAVGVPPHAYVLQRRVAAARSLLIGHPRLAIREIATRVGFSSSSHLASVFRRQTGYSPTTLRRLQ
jgi:AraC family transcriptional regulator